LQNQFNTNQVTAGQIAGNTAAQEAANRIAAGTGMMNLGTQQQKSGLADVDALSTLGGQQQTIAQNQQLFPLDVAAKQMGVLSNAQIPTTTVQSMTGSPLSAIAGLGVLTAGLFGKNASGTSAAGNLYDALGAPIVNGIKDYFGGNTGTTSQYQGLNDPKAMQQLTSGQ
jgi:hypothetical protein